MYDLAGKTAFVTGGGGGIGRSIALRLAEEGCDIALFDRAPAEEAGGKIRAIGRRAIGLSGDVGEFEQLRAAVDEAVSQLGAIDIFVNNAGIARIGALAEMSTDDFRALFRVNVEGVFNGCKAVVPHMIERGCGSIINMSSWTGKSGRPIYGAYSASKFAVIGLTQALAAEVAGKGIRVNAICPGIVVGTDMRSDLDVEHARHGLPPTAERVKAIPLGRPQRAEDVAAIAAFLASDESAYMTGEAVNVSGGLWMD
jgi:NAD(P)-dependent dehydrogenase (short-subunit alcohol dehydrogenase family)